MSGNTETAQYSTAKSHFSRRLPGAGISEQPVSQHVAKKSNTTGRMAWGISAGTAMECTPLVEVFCRITADQNHTVTGGLIEWGGRFKVRVKTIILPTAWIVKTTLSTFCWRQLARPKHCNVIGASRIQVEVFSRVSHSSVASRREQALYRHLCRFFMETWKT